MSRSTIRLWALNLVVNALLVWLIYQWLGIPDRRLWQLAASALVGLAVLVSALWLQAATFAFFRQAGPARIPMVFRESFRRLPAFALWLLLLILVLWGVAWVAGFVPRGSAWLGSALTLRLRRPVSPRSVASALSALVWVIRWVVVPVLLLPVGSQVAAIGWRGLRWKTPEWWCWLAYVVLFACGAYLPYKIVYWVPKFGGIPAQAASLGVRFLVAYLLLTAAWLALTYLTSGGRPSFSHPSTAARP